MQDLMQHLSTTKGFIYNNMILLFWFTDIFIIIVYLKRGGKKQTEMGQTQTPMGDPTDNILYKLIGAFNLVT